MPRQNRVTPFGQLVATPERGMFLGNRGILHDQHGRIRRAFAGRRWIVCVLEFRGRKRTVMKPNSYTELFFLDEATAFAAGHRPCAECRHSRFLNYCRAWDRAHGTTMSRPRTTADEMDNMLHTERLNTDRSKLLFEADLGELPNGAFIKIPHDDTAYLMWNEFLLEWSPAGYARRIRWPVKHRVNVLTPKSSVAVLREGYVPEIHPSAGEWN
jgi:hypothetical protein